MENASKALIIAGAILLSILIIGIGMYVYSSSTATLDSAVSQMSANEIQTFNRQFTQYSGKQSGANVITLLSACAANAAANTGADERLPDIDCMNFADGGKTDVDVVSTGQEANISGINSVKPQIVNSHTYYVQCDLDNSTGLVNKITINYKPVAPTAP